MVANSKIKEEEKKFYTCKWDRAFKEVMLKESNRDILKKILETVLHTKIISITEQNIERNTGNLKVRRKYLDILLETEIGLIGIELNARYEDYLHTRNLAFHCSNYSHYTLVGEEYREDILVIQINFTYGLTTNEKTKDVDLDIVEIYEMQNKKNNKYVTNFPLYEFNMDKIMEFWYSKDKEKIEEYKYLIMLDLQRKDLEILSKEDKLVEKYMSNIEELNQDPEFYVYMTEEEDRRKIYNTEMHQAQKKGLEEGLEKGLKQGIEKGAKQKEIEIAKKMIAKNKPLEEIQEFTNLSLEEIQKLKNKKLQS